MKRLHLTFATVDDVELDEVDADCMRRILTNPLVANYLQGYSTEDGEDIARLPVQFVSVALVEDER